MPAALDRPFRVLAFDWDGTAVADRQEDAGPVRGALEDLLRLGTAVAVITGTNFPNVDRQLTAAIRGAHKRLLYVLTNRGSEVYGFDAQSRPALLWARVATAAEDRLLDEVAEAVRADLVARTGLDVRVISDRMNRRKIDLIPLPEWGDPPKSALGDLARAVESRLRGAGLPGGLRQAIKLVEQTARAKGLAGARVTSDFKHVEVGLTDKSDAMNWVMERLARERGVPAEEVLIGGDEFGAPAGIEGSDHKMMTRRARGAVVVSVGPEPEGVPPGVIHLGGGPARFRALLAAQAALLEGGDRRPTPGKRAEPDGAELPADPTGDPGWLIVAEGYSPAREPEVESLLTTANGYAGTRGSLAEGGAASAPATFVGGLYRTRAEAGNGPELMTLPDWTHLRVVVHGQPLHAGDQGTLAHRRLLDLRQGMLWREWRHRDAGGRVTRLRFLRLLSLAERHAFLQSLALTPENYSGPVVLESRLTAPPHQAGAPSSPQEGILALPVEGSDLTVGLAWNDLCPAAGSRSVEPGPEGAGRPALTRWAFQAEAGRTYRLDRLVCVGTPREAARPAETAAARVRRLRAAGARGLAEAHARAWAERWRTADVQVGGDEEAQRALRFAAYHLIGAADPEDERASAGARGLTGQAYKGHVFWDTEVFAFPFYLYTHPPTARALLMYRYHTLPAARHKARARGYRGALYAWESAGDGREATPEVVVGPDGAAIPVRSGEQEHHISADVAYAVWNYWRVSGDDDFFLRAGAEILLETARFWASRGRFAADGLYHIPGVIGPDEYHEGVEDSAYTNVLAQWNLGRALRAVRVLEERWPRRGGGVVREARDGAGGARAVAAGGRADVHGLRPADGVVRAVPRLLRPGGDRPGGARAAHRADGRGPGPGADGGRPGGQAGGRGHAPGPAVGAVRAGRAPGELPLLRAAHRPRQFAQPGHPRPGGRPVGGRRAGGAVFSAGRGDRPGERHGQLRRRGPPGRAGRAVAGGRPGLRRPGAHPRRAPAGAPPPPGLAAPAFPRVLAGPGGGDHPDPGPAHGRGAVGRVGPHGAGAEGRAVHHPCPRPALLLPRGAGRLGALAGTGPDGLLLTIAAGRLG
jgi:kojibiose phosphorylase